MDSHYEELSERLTSCATIAGDAISSLERSLLDTTLKHGTDLTTEADYISHCSLKSNLAKAFPGICLIMEEQENKANVPDECLVVDELDGTVVYSAGGCDWGVSVAYIEDKQPIVGVIYLPQRSTTVNAIKGGGTFLNGQRVRLLSHVPINRSLILTEINSKLNNKDLEQIIDLTKRSLGVRALACSTASIVDLLLGRGHIYINCHGGKIWDFAAGALAIWEAGGCVVDSAGKAVNWTNLEMNVAMTSSPVLLKELFDNQYD